MTIALIDYGAGNLRSAEKGLERVAREAGRGQTVTLTRDPDVVRRADRVVLPGDGAFPFCRRGVAAIEGMEEALDEFVTQRGRPFLGICVGMQLLATRGLEHEPTDGFGWIDGEVRALQPSDPHLKVPHMGWNTMELVNPHPVLAGIPLGATGLHAYFLHSFAFFPERRADMVAVAEHGGEVTAIVARDNVVGTQFHPEKSQTLGLALLANFLAWAP
ncbi:imidazole glycerol phosphate synthase subunit HisH [Siculibacillus lacustris]|uniref:Imidazole glycerol phosphate synthase subunit HisH n=1 Tax=Siculibacillus lacustris TaxID=1549641 RepID=A0A4Q9VXP1_9HYPH|nr:imidazole glycerol phosphate synthase subunit HisH [Siculibacillus lacustris]TBW41257.1 imidazole glycerol phosphate synthase subunit HisH [Siculibacillus lacustris]